MARRHFSRAYRSSLAFKLCLACAMAVAVSGCGLVPAVVQKTTQVAMLPARTVASAVSRDVRLMTRTFEYGAARVGRGLEVGSSSLSRSARTLSYNTQRVTTPPVQVHTSAAARRAPNRTTHAAHTQAAGALRPDASPNPAETEVPPPPQVDVLPSTVLAELTEDQAGLQRAAQAEAFSAPVGEEIYWEVDGRTGSAVAESENAMGSFTCRTFVQTLTMEDDTLVEGETMMCRTEGGAWSASF